MRNDPFIPEKATITEIREETSDVKTFRVKPEQGFSFIPGQCAMLSLFGVGEAIFSISSSPSQEEMEFSIKDVGRVTHALHEAEEGLELGIRGPYGNGFPLEDMKGNHLLFIGGGIGLAPLRPLIFHACENKEDFGALQLIYGARSPEDLVFKKDLFETWKNDENISIYLSSDIQAPGWDGYVGFVPQYLEELAPNPEGTIAITCGPPVMIKFVLQTLEKLNFKPDQVITTLEYKMKCGIGKCGRCNIGEKYVCIDGPVFYLEQLQALQGSF